MSTISTRCDVCDVPHDSLQGTHPRFEKAMILNGWTKLINSETRKVSWVCPQCAFVIVEAAP